LEDSESAEEEEEEVIDTAAYDKSKIGKGDEDYELVPVNEGGV
jgi:hypothetical protein